jgi:hypothetical protein
MDDEEKLSILGVGSGIALTPEDALALVFIEELADEEKRDLPQIDGEVAQYCECAAPVQKPRPETSP